MATTSNGLTSPGVVTTINSILTQIRPEVIEAKQFITDFSSEIAQIGTRVRVPFVNAGTAEGFVKANKNFEHPTGGFSDVFVDLDTFLKVTVPIDTTDQLELTQSSYWDRVVESGKISIGKALSQKICGLFNETDVTTTETLASADKSVIAQLTTKCAGRVGDTNLLLAPWAFADLLSQLGVNVYGSEDAVKNGVIPELYGFKSIIRAKDLPQGVNGALVPSDAVAIVGRQFSVPDPAAYSEFGTSTDDATGFTLTGMRHTALATGEMFINVGALCGAKLIRPADCVLLVAQGD